MKKLIKKIKALFENKKKRYLYLFLFILPFVVAIGIFSFVSVKEVKNILSLLTTIEVKDEYQIKTQNYLLRDNATDYQLELFTELKGMIEGEIEHTPEQLAESVCKNFVADFYTWTNKAGQYDVGGLYYVYSPQRKTIYIQARDEFYKYINEYINSYGAENLLEIVEVSSSSSKYPEEYYIARTEDGVETAYDEAYVVACTWSYKEGTKFSTNGYVRKMNFVVINNEDRYEIVEAYE